MQALAAYIEHAIVAWGAFGVFIGSVLEEVVVPIPSSLVQAGAGIFFLSGQAVTFATILKLITWIAIPAAVGVVLGSLPVYFLTYYGGMPAIRKFGKWFFLNPDKVEETRQNIISKPRTVWVITGLRFIPLLPSAFVTAAAGLVRLPFWQYVYSSLIGVFIRALYLGIIGWATGSVTGASTRPTTQKIVILVVVLLVISGITSLLINHAHKRSKKKAV